MFYYFGCNLFNKTITEGEYQEFTKNEISRWGLNRGTQFEYCDLLIESTNEVTDFYSNPYADSEIAFLYLTTIKENQEKFREMIKTRESINPPEKYKESNEKFLQGLERILGLLEDQEKLILDKGYETLTREDLGSLAKCELGILSSYMGPMQDYKTQLEDEYYQSLDDYIQELKDQQTNN